MQIAQTILEHLGGNRFVAMPLRRKIEQWRNGDPEAMATQQSRAAIFYAFQDARADILALYALAERVARLNPAAGEIGAGMLASLVEQARNLTNHA